MEMTIRCSSMPHSWSFCAFIWCVAFVSHGAATANSKLGINYGMLGDNLPPPSEVVSILQSISMNQTRIYSDDADVLRAFANTGISIAVTVNNEDVAQFSGSLVYATNWVEQNIAAFYPSTQITAILVGNEVYTGNDTNIKENLLPAIQNIYSALQSSELSSQIYVSTPHSLAVLSSSFPPSQGIFVSAIASKYLMPLLQFLRQISAPFLINAYPFFAYEASPSTVSLSYVLFEGTTDSVTDPVSGHVYTNMLDAQVDAVYSALAAVGFGDLSVTVSETGWPSAGDADESGASVANAQAYNSNLIARILSNQGTPSRPSLPLQVFMFALFNEDLKPGPTSERHYGLFYPNGTRVYDFGLGSARAAYALYNTISSSSWSSRAPLLGPCALPVFLLVSFVSHNWARFMLLQNIH